MKDELSCEEITELILEYYNDKLRPIVIFMNKKGKEIETKSGFSETWYNKFKNERENLGWECLIKLVLALELDYNDFFTLPQWFKDKYNIK